MKDGESLTQRQIDLKTLTIGKFKQIIRKSKLPDDAPMFADSERVERHIPGL